MSLVTLDARLAELATLDIVEIGPDLRLRLSAKFVAECVRALDEDPRRLATVVQERILARARAYGFAGCADLDELALAALELGAAEEHSASA